MLYTKDINSIEYDDIRLFCNRRLPEGTRVDYKADFPKDLAKLIAAFANTEGGIVLIGVKTDQSNRPSDICGVKFESGLQERITSISISNIVDPIIPEIKVCPFKSDLSISEPDRAVIVVRVDESFEAPLAVDGKAYVRVGGQCEPADLKTIEALFKRGEKGKEVLQNILESLIGPQGQLRRMEFEDKLPCRTVIVCPLYPTKRIIEFNKESEDFLRRSPSELHFGYLQPIQNGLAFKFDSATSKGYYVEITGEGLIVYHEPLENGVHIGRTIMVVGRILEYARGVFERFGFYGKILIILRLNGTKGKHLTADPPRSILHEYIFPEDEAVVKQEFSVDGLREELDSAVVSIVKEFCRIAGLVPDGHFGGYVSSTLGRK